MYHMLRVVFCLPVFARDILRNVALIFLQFLLLLECISIDF